MARNAAENVVELKNRINELEDIVKYYEEQFRLAKDRKFGVSSEKSEYDFGQLCLFNEAELFSVSKTPESELVEIEKHYRKHTRLTTDKLPYDLSVEVVGTIYRKKSSNAPTVAAHYTSWVVSADGIWMNRYCIALKIK